MSSCPINKKELILKKLRTSNNLEKSMKNTHKAKVKGRKLPLITTRFWRNWKKLRKSIKQQRRKKIELMLNRKTE